MSTPERGYTEAEYRNAVCRKLKEGCTYKLWIREASIDSQNPKLQVKIRLKLKVMHLNRHIVHFVDEKGRNTCYQYIDIYRMIRGDV